MGNISQQTIPSRGNKSNIRAFKSRESLHRNTFQGCCFFQTAQQTTQNKFIFKYVNTASQPAVQPASQSDQQLTSRSLRVCSMSFLSKSLSFILSSFSSIMFSHMFSLSRCSLKCWACESAAVSRFSRSAASCRSRSHSPWSSPRVSAMARTSAEGEESWTSLSPFSSSSFTSGSLRASSWCRLCTHTMQS